MKGTPLPLDRAGTPSLSWERGLGRLGAQILNARRQSERTQPGSRRIVTVTQWH